LRALASSRRRTEAAVGRLERRGFGAASTSTQLLARLGPFSD
jgi:hypothetical protein